MGVYFLRHEQRPMDDPSFYTNLTVEGLYNAKNLASVLKKNNITKIYCSPFIRCLQTIHPYVKQTKIKVNIDWGIQESFHHYIFSKHNYTELSKDELEFYNYNKDYKSSMKPNVLKYQETLQSIYDRVLNFFVKIKLDDKNSDENILICTHMGIINMLLTFFNIERKINSLYLMGRLSTIKNNKLHFLN